MATALLIDDDLIRRAQIEAILKAAGLAVYAAADGHAVVCQARELRPNFIVVPLELTGIDLPEFCQTLRAVLVGASTALVVVASGRVLAIEGPDGAEAGRIRAALASGADDVLTDDEVPAVAVNRLQRLLRFHQLTAMAILNEQLAQVGRLVAGIIHEIRSPLTVIRGNAELMAIELGQDHAAGIWFRPILRNAQTLQVRLEHLMAAVRLGPCDPQPCDVVPIVHESINLFEKGVDSCRGRVAITLTLGPPSGPIPLVMVDAGRLIQVILNLLANAQDAILSEQNSGRIDVQIQAKPDSGEVQIDVRDNGPGVGPCFLDRIFEPFFTTKTGGTGYGLYLAAEILREHGGRLAACNHDDGGACFTIHLPVASTDPAGNGAR